MYVYLLDYTSGAQKVMATISIQNGVMAIEGTIPPGVRNELDNARRRTPEGDAFLRGLPKIFSGTYLRAEFHE